MIWNSRSGTEEDVDAPECTYDLRALRLSCLRHASCDLGRIALDAADEGVRERMALRPVVLGSNYYDL